MESTWVCTSISAYMLWLFSSVFIVRLIIVGTQVSFKILSGRRILFLLLGYLNQFWPNVLFPGLLHPVLPGLAVVPWRTASLWRKQGEKWDKFIWVDSKTGRRRGIGCCSWDVLYKREHTAIKKIQTNENVHEHCSWQCIRIGIEVIYVWKRGISTRMVSISPKHAFDSLD